MTPPEPRARAVMVSAPAKRPTLVDYVGRLESAGDPLPSGIRTLDKASRGGFRRGRRIVFIGEPGSAKTTLAMTLALQWALAGVVVVWLAVDESPEELLVRVAQQLGLDRDAVERADPETLERLRALVLEIPTLVILDADDGATVDDAIAVANTMRADGPGAVIVDSAQTARAAGSDDARTDKARVDAVVVAFRRGSREGLLMLMTSESNRASYGTRKPGERVNDIAAGKESGGLEYAGQTLLVLRPVPDRVGEIDVSVAKNRGGERTPFRLIVDFKHAKVHETARPTDLQPVPGAELASDMARVREVLRDAPRGVSGQEALCAKLGIQASRGRRAIKAMIEAGEVRIEKGPGTARRLFLDINSSESSQVVRKSSGTSDNETRPTRPSPIRGTSRRDESGDETDGADSSRGAGTLFDGPGEGSAA